MAKKDPHEDLVAKIDEYLQYFARRGEHQANNLLRDARVALGGEPVVEEPAAAEKA